MAHGIWPIAKLMSKVTKEEIKKIASLAKLSFDDSGLERFEKEFNSILNYISLINECDTSGIEFEHHMNDFKGKVLQEDKAHVSLSREKALQNATQGRSKGGYIKVSKIVNKE
jgi:aspartyl-tRNA(Asn)/glutamyl-tRNA(Gln) amidotransferase subunit C